MRGYSLVKLHGGKQLLKTLHLNDLQNNDSFLSVRVLVTSAIKYGN